jgi:hypothetical protein
MVDLLALSGRVPRSASRADCTCSGHSRATISFNREVAFCFRCGWRTNSLQLARALGIRGVGRAPASSCEQDARRRHLWTVAANLCTVEDFVELEMRDVLLSFASIRRNAAARLAAIKAGAPERFQNEQEFGWLALKFVADSEIRAEASYLIAALAVPADRARFALIPEARTRMTDAALVLGYVRTSAFHRVEIRT